MEITLTIPDEVILDLQIGKANSAARRLLSLAAIKAHAHDLITNDQVQEILGSESDGELNEIPKPVNYISISRRIAEATLARLHYDYLCFKGPVMDESYLAHCVSDILCTFYDPNREEIQKNYMHSGLKRPGKGAKPSIDYVVTHRSTKKCCWQ